MRISRCAELLVLVVTIGALTGCPQNSQIILPGPGPAAFTHLYVANGAVTPAPQVWQFALPLTNSSSPTLTMADNGMNVPDGIAFGRSSNMYVLNLGGAHSFITVFAPGVSANSAPIATIMTSLTDASHVAIDPGGLVWTCSFNGSQCFQYPGPYSGNVSPSPTITLSAGIDHPEGLGFNAEGDLFVANSTLGGGIVRFNHPITNGQGNSGILSTSGDTAHGVAFDPAGNLYTTDGDGGDILRWNANHQGDGATPDFIDSAAGGGFDVSTDAAGNLYSLPFGPCSVWVFPNVASTFSNTLPPTVKMPLPAGCLFVSGLALGP